MEAQVTPIWLTILFTALLIVSSFLVVLFTGLGAKHAKRAYKVSIIFHLLSYVATLPKEKTQERKVAIGQLGRIIRKWLPKEAKEITKVFWPEDTSTR